jgi:diazepam-binding inhibitor (GABA receptor modulating acyl-CoA-binding protein)
MFDPKGKAKWDAWDKCKGVSSEEAMKNYVELVASLKAKYA